MEIANERYSKNITRQMANSWDFRDVYPNITNKEVVEIFSSVDFFNELKPQDYFLDCYKEVKDIIDLSFVTVGVKENLQLKDEYISNTLGIDDYNFCGILLNGFCGDKSCLDMSNGIFIDDRIDCLRSSNAKIKILYIAGEQKNWQYFEPNEEIYVVKRWEDIEEIIKFFHRFQRKRRYYGSKNKKNKKKMRQ